MDLPLRKPCCLGSTQLEKVASQAYRAELATMRLSVLTMLCGLVFCESKAGVLPKGVAASTHQAAIRLEKSLQNSKPPPAPGGQADKSAYTDNIAARDQLVRQPYAHDAATTDGW